MPPSKNKRHPKHGTRHLSTPIGRPLQYAWGTIGSTHLSLYKRLQFGEGFVPTEITQAITRSLSKPRLLRPLTKHSALMEHYLPCDFVNVPPHPLIYASLKPRHSASYARRIDLHRPQTRHTIGRSPMNDFVLDAETGQIGEPLGRHKYSRPSILIGLIRLDALYPLAQ